ncbi:MAG: nitric oxide reductase transcriptional regulator NorR [Formivibrio sp.]|nr:nitric oxide reductase transcriptional regulator NorR [Formivibrio sp.]
MMDTLLLADLVAELPRTVRLQRLVNAMRMHFRCGAVGLLKVEGDALCPIAIDGLVRETLGRRFVVAQHPRLSAILASNAPVRFPFDSTLPDPYDGLLDNHMGEPLPVHDCMGISLSLDGKLWGAITLDALSGDVFGEKAREELIHMALITETAVRLTRLEEENRSLRAGRAEQETLAHTTGLSGEIEIIGQSLQLQNLLQELDMVADSELPVLLLGETGVGKELFARRLHRVSRRKGKPLIQVNCAALPESLAESELFGHVKGAFSGAINDRAGRIEAAEGGTLFLDEVGELPLPVQAKLLRTLQNGEIQRLGADKPHKVNVRIVAATNRQLHDQVREGHFRADLYHRLSVYPVLIPPLRERGNDVLLLAGSFLELNRTRLGVRSLRLSPEAEQALCAYAWPGNVRELEHVISRAALRAVSRGAKRTEIVTLEPEHLDLDLTRPGLDLSQSANAGIDNPIIDKGNVPLKIAIDTFQRQLIRQTLVQCQDNWASAARSLGIDASNLHKLSRRLGIKA